MFKVDDIVLVKEFYVNKVGISPEEQEIMSEVKNVIGKVASVQSTIRIDFHPSIKTKTSKYPVEYWYFTTEDAVELIDVQFTV